MEVISSLVQFFQDLITNGPSNLVSMLMSVLPLSPFQPYISAFENLPYIGWINWFVPVQGYLIVWGAWLSAVSLHFFYSAILRWLNMIQ